jgi:HJR/Mrr/RecB family endonuclease
MSQKNGEKSRFQINRKRAVVKRAKLRALVAAAAGAPGEKAQVVAKTRRAKG